MRIEEIPYDQVALEENETLIPVCYYDKFSHNMFGVGFFVKIVDKEHFDEVKDRIKKSLRVSDQEFEKVCFDFMIKIRIIFSSSLF